jgi:hypothetical protein
MARTPAVKSPEIAMVIGTATAAIPIKVLMAHFPPRGSEGAMKMPLIMVSRFAELLVGDRDGGKVVLDTR